MKNPSINVTGNDLELTAKITLAHLNEFPAYYNNEYGLPPLNAYYNQKMNNIEFSSFND